MNTTTESRPARRPTRLVTKGTHLSPELASELDAIVKASRLPASRILQLALERLVEEVRTTGRLPFIQVQPPTDLATNA